MATIILENARVRVGLLQVPCLVFSHELAGHHVFDHMPATGSLPRSSAPSRYRLRCVVRRSVLPRERFSPLANFRHGAMSDLSPLSAPKRTFANDYARLATRPSISAKRNKIDRFG